MRSALVAGLVTTAIVVTPSSIAASATGSPSKTSAKLPTCLTALKPSPLLTATQLQTLREKVTGAVLGNLEEFTVCAGGPILVTLSPGKEELAKQLATIYRTRVSINVGRTHWNGTPANSAACEDLAKPRQLPASLTATYIPSEASVTSGTRFNGVIRVTNRGTKEFTVTTGTGGAFVIDRGTRQIVGGTWGFKLDVLTGYTLRPGDTQSPLPPGRYDVIAGFGVRAATTTGAKPGKKYQYLTSPVPIDVTP
jgi:hypothetical protein